MKTKRKGGSRGKIRVALIGAGSMANNVHYPSLAEFDDVELVGLCDLVPEKLENTAQRFGIRRTFNDFRAMLEATKPDAVYALMPPHHLFDVAMAVLQAGHDLFVEKPPALTSFQTECLAKAAADAGAVTGVGFQRRYHPLFVQCWNETRKHGPLHQVVATFYKNQEPARVHQYYRGAIDILTSDAIHAVDAMRYFAGGDVVSVASDVRKIDSWYNTCFNALVTFSTGATGVLLTNWRTGSRRLTLELHAPGASAFANADGLGEVWADNAKEPTLRLTHTEAAGSESGHVHQGFRAQARAFIDAVKTRRQPHNTIADAYKTMRLVDLIYQNAINVSQNGAHLKRTRQAAHV
ncbi:MAG: Gfo/Idh/MocA family oxidoreductase [Kiritimatiellae bacterium]|nr:Gfo/Idh/MocA family oxidoreductase [Kiritimatiellia bacterium]